MARLVVFNRGGAGGKVAINADLVTDVRSAGAFTDVFCGGRQIAVDGSFEQVVSMLSQAGRDPGSAGAADRSGSRGAQAFPTTQALR